MKWKPSGKNGVNKKKKKEHLFLASQEEDETAEKKKAETEVGEGGMGEEEEPAAPTEVGEVTGVEKRWRSQSSSGSPRWSRQV